MPETPVSGIFFDIASQQRAADSFGVRASILRNPHRVERFRGMYANVEKT